MTPDKYIDLNTPEADRQPRARCSASPSHVAAEALPIDLTADTPPPVSARGIADNENYPRGGDDVRNDFDRPPYLPRLHEMCENARSNTPHSRPFAPLLVPVTNSSSLPRKKKFRSSRHRYSGKENSSRSESLSWRERTHLGGPESFPTWRMVSFLANFFPRYQSLRITPGEMTLGGQLLFGAHHQHIRKGVIS